MIDQFVQQSPDSPRLALVRFQGALALVARGELSRQEAEVVSDNVALLNKPATACVWRSASSAN